VTANANARAILSALPETVTLVAMGGEGIRRTDEMKSAPCTFATGLRAGRAIPMQSAGSS
jgi:hypothetical protein